MHSSLEKRIKEFFFSSSHPKYQNPLWPNSSTESVRVNLMIPCRFGEQFKTHLASFIDVYFDYDSDKCFSPLRLEYLPFVFGFLRYKFLSTLFLPFPMEILLHLYPFCFFAIYFKFLSRDNTGLKIDFLSAIT